MIGPAEFADIVEDVMADCGQDVLRLADADPTTWRKSTPHGSEQVSDIDLAVHSRLVRELRQRLPGLAIISEEGPPRFRRPLGDEVLAVVIDPIDGTNAAIAGSGDFAICAGLLINSVPVAGLMTFPKLGLSVRAVTGLGTVINGEPVPPAASARIDRPRIVVSPGALTHPVTAAIAGQIPGSEVAAVPAFSPKALALLAGQADAAVFLPGVSRPFATWDVLAGAFALAEAQFTVADFTNRSLVGKCADMLASGISYDPGGWVAGPPELCHLLRKIVSGIA